MRWPRERIGAVLVVTAIGCAPAGHPALRVPLETFRAQVGTVCIAPPASGFVLPDHDSRMARVQAALADALQRHGYRTAAPAEVLGVHRRVAERHGGAYDPHSGRWQEERGDLIRRDFHATLASELGCDALLHPSVVVVRANWADGKAKWDGVSQGMGGRWGTSGWVTALSLYVRLEDMQERELYFSTGGIEVLAHQEPGFFSSDVRTVDAEHLLVDVHRIQQAADASLEALGPD